MVPTISLFFRRRQIASFNAVQRLAPTNRKEDPANWRDPTPVRRMTPVIYHPLVPAAPLNGPTIREVIQPP